MTLDRCVVMYANDVAFFSIVIIFIHVRHGATKTEKQNANILKKGQNDKGIYSKTQVH